MGRKYKDRHKGVYKHMVRRDGKLVWSGRWRAEWVIDWKTKKKEVKYFDDEFAAVRWRLEKEEQREKNGLLKEVAKKEGITIEDAVEQYLRYAKQRYHINTYQNKKRVFDGGPGRTKIPARTGFIVFVEGKKLTEITTSDVDRYLEYLQKPSALEEEPQPKPKRANAARKELRTFFRWCSDKKRKYCESNPAEDSERYKEPKTKKRVATKDEMDRMMGEALKMAKKHGHSQDYNMLATLAFTGMRKGGLLGLEWGESVDLENREIKISTAKTRFGDTEDYLVPIIPELYEVLESQKQICERYAADGVNHVFINLNPSHKSTGQYGKPMEFVSDFVKRYAKKAGIKDASRVSYHAFRRGCASYLFKRGVPMHVIQRILGHKRVSTTEKYVYSMHTEEETRAALERAFRGAFGNGNSHTEVPHGKDEDSSTTGVDAD